MAAPPSRCGRSAPVLAAEERFEEAERVLAEALAQDRTQHGADGVDTARSLSQLANLHLRQGRAGDALPLLEEAAAIDQGRLGPTHPVIADDLHDLGLAYAALPPRRAPRRCRAFPRRSLSSGCSAGTDAAVAHVELNWRLHRIGT